MDRKHLPLLLFPAFFIQSLIISLFLSSSPPQDISTPNPLIKHCISRVLASRPLAMKHLLGQTPVAPGGQEDPVPAAILARGRQGLEEEGWREAGHLPQGWLQKARDDSHHSYLTQNYDTLKSVKTAVSYMKMKGYSYIEVEKFWQTAPLPSSGRSKELRVEWQGQQSQEGGSTWRKGRHAKGSKDDSMQAHNIKTKNMMNNPSMGRIQGSSKNNYDKILVHYENGSRKSIDALDQEAKEQRKTHEMEMMEQYLKTVPSKNIMEEEDTSENITEPEDNDEVNEEDKRFMLDERDTSEDLTDDEEDSKPKIQKEVSIKLPEDDASDTSENLTGDEEDIEPKILEQSILKTQANVNDMTSNTSNDSEEGIKAQETKDGFSEIPPDDQNHKDDQAIDENVYRIKNKEPVSDDEMDEASTDEDSSTDDEDNPVIKNENLNYRSDPPSPPPRPSSPSCGSCSGCLMEDDCGCCRACADSPEFGGEGRLMGQRCATRRCTNQVIVGFCQLFHFYYDE